MAASELAQLSSANENLEKISWWGMRPRRTQARPKQTLFGTCMESVDKSVLDGTQGKFIPEGYIRPQINRYPLPDYLEKQLTGRVHADASRQEFIEQKNVVTEIDKEIKQKCESAYAFKPPKPSSSQTSTSASSRPTWLTEEDIKHSKDMNIVGLNDRGSFNRDKYAKKPHRHNYSLIGDIMAKNMDFKTPRTVVDDAPVSEHKVGRRGRTQNLQIKIDESMKRDDCKSKSLVKLPANIRHMFGSQVCDNLLADKILVDQALERQRTISGPLRPSKKENVESLPIESKGNYDSLGQAMRYNTFPGCNVVTSEHQISRTKDDFNKDVHIRRDANPDQFRYQRDELSSWSEQNVLRDRMKKAWNETYPLGGNK